MKSIATGRRILQHNNAAAIIVTVTAFGSELVAEKRQFWRVSSALFNSVSPTNEPR